MSSELQRGIGTEYTNDRGYHTFTVVLPFLGDGPGRDRELLQALCSVLKYEYRHIKEMLERCHEVEFEQKYTVSYEAWPRWEVLPQEDRVLLSDSEKKNE